MHRRNTLALCLAAGIAAVAYGCANQIASVAGRDVCTGYTKFHAFADCIVAALHSAAASEGGATDLTASITRYSAELRGYVDARRTSHENAIWALRHCIWELNQTERTRNVEAAVGGTLAVAALAAGAYALAESDLGHSGPSADHFGPLLLLLSLAPDVQGRRPTRLS